MIIQDKIIGVIGYGNFGKVVCDYLFPKNNIILYSSRDIKTDSRVSLTRSLNDVVKKSDIIIPAVPICEFENIIQKIKTTISPEKILIDICSVKEYPVAVMKKYLPDVQYIATHPMFGPSSIKKNNNEIRGLTIVCCPIERSTIYSSLIDYCKENGLTVKEITPDEHDILAAYSQFFSLVVREMGNELRIKPTPIDTPGAQAMLELLAYGFDTKITKDMLRYNAYCSGVLKKMHDTITQLQGE